MVLLADEGNDNLINVAGYGFCDKENGLPGRIEFHLKNFAHNEPIALTCLKQKPLNINDLSHKIREFMESA